MTPKTISKLQYFAGKVCSIFTGPINRTFDETHSREHFVVKVQEIDIDGLWGTHPYNGTVSFFPLNDIKLITEEIVLDPDNPVHAKMLQQYQEKTGETIISDVSPHLAPIIPPPPPPSQLVTINGLKPSTQPVQEMEPAFVDIKHLSALAKSTKKSLDISEAL
jgi:hypothetical protein